MKNLLLVLTLITLTFLSCSKNDDDTPPTSLYAGSWSGTYSGDGSGTFTMNVTEASTLSGSFVKTTGSVFNFTGTVAENGAFNMAFSNGGNGTGQFNAETSVVFGNWIYLDPGGNETGSFDGTKN